MDYFEPTQVLESTQKISTNTNKSNQVVGHLLIKGIIHNLFHGENTIGRDPSCSIVINDKPVSAKHAVLEVENDTLHCIYDLGSSNKTKLRKAFIKPNVRYVLNDGDELVFGNVSAIYNHASPEEFEIEVDRTEILTIPETPEKEAKTDFVAEIPKSTICDSDDSNTDLFDDSQSGRISFQIPNFEVKENNTIYNICTQSVQKNISIYEVDTQSFVENNKDNEENNIIYDINTEAFPEKLNNEEINERPILSKPRGSFEDLFCDSVQSPVKNIFSNDKFSEDIFQSSQSKFEKMHDSKDLKPQNCIESTSLSNAPQNVENCSELGSNTCIQFIEQNEVITSNLKEENHGQIGQEKISVENEPNLLVVNNCESKDMEKENDEIEQNLIFEDKINFVEQKNFWMIESEKELETEDNEQSKTEKVNPPEKSKNDEKLDESSNQPIVEDENNCESTKPICTIQHANKENHEDKINPVEPKNLWEIQTEAYKVEDHQILKNNLENSQVDAILKDVHGETEEPKNLWEMETEPYKVEDHQKLKNNLQNSQVAAILKYVRNENEEKLDKSSNQQNIEAENNCEERTKNICTIQHANEENHEDKINFVEPKNLWNFETEVLTTEDHQKLKNSQVDAILEDVQNKHDKKMDDSSNQPNEKVKKNCEEHTKNNTIQNTNEENHEDKINFVEPKNLWNFEVLTTEDHQKLKNKDVQSEQAIFAEEVLKDDELSLDENLKLNTKHDETSKQQNVEVINNCEEHIKDICTIQHATEEGLNIEDNIWEMETEELVADDQKLEDNLEKSEVALILEEDALSKKICLDESYKQKILNFVRPKKNLEIETDVLNTEDQKLQDNLEKSDFSSILEDIESEKVPSFKKIQLFKNDILDESLKLNKLNTKLDKSINNVVVKNNSEDLNDICVIPYVNLNKDLNNDNFVKQKFFKETQELATDQKEIMESQISLALENVESENKELQVISEQIEQKSSEKIQNDFKIPSFVQEVIEKDDRIDSTLEDEDFEGFESNDFKNNHNVISKKLDVESEMALLFGTSVDTQIKNVMNGEDDVNYLKKILEDTSELEQTETQTEFEINSELSVNKVLKFDVNISNISEMCIQPDNSNEMVEKTQNIQVDQNYSNLSEMTTQVIINPNEIDVVEKTTQDMSVEKIDNLSEMTTQAVPINSIEIDVFESTTQDNVDKNNDNWLEMSTQAVIINPTKIDVAKRTTEDIKVDQNNDNLNMPLSDMCTQAVIINPTDVVERTTEDIKVDNNLSEMCTQAVIINQTDVVEITTEDIKVDQNNDNLNMSISDMCTQAVIINPTDVVERTTQGIKVDDNLSEMSTQGVIINPTKIDVVERTTEDIKVDQNNDNLNMSISDMCTQAVVINPIDVFERIKQGIKVDDNLSEMSTQGVIINPNEIDVVERTKQDINFDQNVNLSEMITQTVQIDVNEKLTQNINFDQNKSHNSEQTQNILESSKNENNIKNANLSDCTEKINKTDSTISEIPSKKVRKSRININTNKIVKKPKLALQINKHSSTLPDINRSSFFINQQKTSQSLILESNKNLLDSSDDDDCPNKRPRLFVISDDEDDEPIQKSENAFQLDFKQRKSVRPKIYNSNESIYSAVSMDETVINSDMEETLCKKNNQNSKFTMSPFLSKIIETEEVSPKTVSPKPKEFGRGKRTRVIKMYKDYETDDTVEEILNKKIKLEIQPSGSNEQETKQKRFRVAKNKLNSTPELEDNQIRKNSRSRQTPIVQLLNEENISKKPSKMGKKTIKLEENLDLNESKDCTNKEISYERSSRKRRTATSETSSKCSISTKEQNIQNPSKMTKSTKKQSEENISVDKPVQSDSTENDQKTYKRSNRKKPNKSSVSETSSNCSISTKEQNIQNPSKMTKNTKKQSEENISVDKPEKSDSTENDQKTYKRSNRKKPNKSSNCSISSSIKEQNVQNPSKMTKNTKKLPEENISVDKPGKSDCTENDQKTYERSPNRKKTTKSSAPETSSNCSISTKEQNIQNPSKMTKNTKKPPEEIDKPGKSDCTKNDHKTYERSNNRKKTTKSSVSESSNVPTSTSSTRVTRSRGKNGGKNEHGKLKILFNGDYDEDMALIIDRLNGEIVENPYTCTVVVAEKFEPTVNLLCGLSQGRPIVSFSWLHCSRDAGYFIDPYKHLLMDKKGEEKFSFCLKNSINKAMQSQLLKGWSIFATPSTKPSPEELKSIVECSGGVFLKKLPPRKTQNIIVISCPDDEIKSKIIPKIVSSETFITSVLRQSLDFNA